MVQSPGAVNEYLLKDTIQKQVHVVRLVEGDNGQVSFEGLPKKFEYDMF